MNETWRSARFSLGVYILAVALALVSCGLGSDEAASTTPTQVATTEPVATLTATADIPESTVTPTPEATSTTAPPTATAPVPTATSTPPPQSTATSTPVPTATTAPTSTPQPTATPSPVATPTPSPPPTVISAEAGEDFFVSLPLDQTTNFRWELDELPEGSLLKLIDEITIAPGGGTTDSTGWQHFLFRGDADGQATLTFLFVQPDGTPMDAVHYSVIIGSGSPACSGVFHVAIGETFEIVLQSDSSTGFRWELREPPTGDAVTLVRSEYIAASTASVGVSGWHRFTFRGTFDGESELNFWYVRPLADPPAPANLANYRAIVGTGVPGCSGIFTVGVGETFEISLAANPSTGYRWELSEKPTPGVVTLLNDEFIPSNSTVVGAPGVQRLTLIGTAAGETRLKFWYVRPFDDPPAPADQIAFMAIVDS